MTRNDSNINAILQCKETREEGFTLVELLVVIIIIAILATIAIPTFLSQREKANDSAAYTLVRNALTAVQSTFVDSHDYRTLTVSELTTLEPSIDWVVADANLVGVSPPMIGAVSAEARDNQVAVYGQAADVVDIATRSASGNRFGIQVDAVDLSQTGYVKVKVIDGSSSIGW